MSNSSKSQRGPRVHIGKALLALLYANLAALPLAVLAGILSVDWPAAMDPQYILFWIFMGFIYFSTLALLPFVAGLAVHAFIGGRLRRPSLGLLLAVIGVSVGLAQAFGLMELGPDQPMARILLFVGAGLVSPFMALWAGLYALFLRSPAPTA